MGRRIKTSQDAVNRLKELGWEVHYYSPEDQLIKTLKLDQQAARSQAFSFRSNDFKFVFIKKGLSEQDKLFLLSHELGHITLNHDLGNLSVESEKAANRFANKHIGGISRLKILWIGIAVAALISVVCVFIFIPINRTPVVGQRNEPTSMPYIDTELVTPSPSLIAANSDNIVYLTSNGDKYHKRGCYIIKNKSNLVKMSMDSALSLGKEPCEACFPEMNQ